MYVPGRVVKRMVAAPWVHPKTGTLYYRKVVPERARHLFGGNREVRRSLKTRNMAEARLRHAQIAADVEASVVRDPVHDAVVWRAGAWRQRWRNRSKPARQSAQAEGSGTTRWKCCSGGILP